MNEHYLHNKLKFPKGRRSFGGDISGDATGRKPASPRAKIGESGDTISLSHPISAGEEACRSMRLGKVLEKNSGNSRCISGLI